MLKVVEAFSGIGAQKEALERADIDHEIINTIEWDINAIIAYDIMHHNDISPSNLSKNEIINKLKSDFTLSSDGKKVLSERGLKSIKEIKLKRLYSAIDRNRNLCDITKVTGISLPNDTDLLTYSFPCQDLSIASYWHNKDNDGISKGANTRSGLLWEIERILKERIEVKLSLPKFLLMENVNTINSPKHNENFKRWQFELENMGYINKVYKRLNSLDFGIPQSRSRTFMLSVRTNKISKDAISDLNCRIPYNLGEYLRLDNAEEALAATPNPTPSRVKICKQNKHLIENNIFRSNYTNTISTKQDRNPNAGVIIQNERMRYLTPRETFLLMGFPEEKFDRLIEINNKDRCFSNCHFYRMAGNSIVVNILVEIFKEIERLKEICFNE